MKSLTCAIAFVICLAGGAYLLVRLMPPVGPQGPPRIVVPTTGYTPPKIVDLTGYSNDVSAEIHLFKFHLANKEIYPETIWVESAADGVVKLRCNSHRVEFNDKKIVKFVALQ